MNPSRDTRIVITAPRKMFVTSEVQQKIVGALAFLPEDAFVSIRARSDGRPSSYVEGWLLKLHARKDVPTPWTLTVYKASKERGGAWKRDRSMVEGASRVIAFFDESNFMEGGTGHVVQCALEADVPVEAWAQTFHGLELVAEDDKGVDHTETWLKSRMAADLVMKFRDTAMSVKPYAPSYPASPSTRSSSTATGSTSTVLTGGVRFRHGSTKRQPPLDLAAHPRSPLSSSPI